MLSRLISAIRQLTGSHPRRDWRKRVYETILNDQPRPVVLRIPANLIYSVIAALWNQAIIVRNRPLGHPNDSLNAEIASDLEELADTLSSGVLPCRWCGRATTKQDRWCAECSGDDGAHK